MSENAKVVKRFDLAVRLAEALETFAKKRGLTQTAVVHQALWAYIKGQNGYQKEETPAEDGDLQPD